MVSDPLHWGSVDDERKLSLLASLRREGIDDERVLAALERIPRTYFVDPELRDAAWENVALAIPQGQTISQPFVVALMSQALALTGSERVLEVGTGSGYQAAVLALLAKDVITIERIAVLAEIAAERFEVLGLHNVTSIVGDGTRGWEPEAPFDAIMVTAGAREVPPALLEQLADEGGRMVIPVGRRCDEHLQLFRKINGELIVQDLGGVRFVPLISDRDEGNRP